MSGNSTKPLGEGLGIAVGATGADLGAAASRGSMSRRSTRCLIWRPSPLFLSALLLLDIRADSSLAPHARKVARCFSASRYRHTLPRRLAAQSSIRRQGQRRCRITPAPWVLRRRPYGPPGRSADRLPRVPAAAPQPRCRFEDGKTVAPSTPPDSQQRRGIPLSRPQLLHPRRPSGKKGIGGAL